MKTEIKTTNEKSHNINLGNQYKIESDSALNDFQSGIISFYEWNSRQKIACRTFFAGVKV